MPVSQLHLISRYSGQARENVALHKLGSAHGTKRNANRRKARDTAELLNLYAQRAAPIGTLSLKSTSWTIRRLPTASAMRKLKTRLPPSPP